jgi:hypothetical protein
MHEYSTDWYDLVTAVDLRQGDIFRDLLAFWLPQHLPVLAADPIDDEESSVKVAFARGNWIVLSASCDVVRGDNTHVILARVVDAKEENLKAPNQKALEDKIEVLRQGYDPARFLLAPCLACNPRFPLSFVEYRQQAFLPLTYLKGQPLDHRIRLKSPFREKLGAWAAANLGRVGVEDESQIPRQSGFSASAVLKTVEEPPY